MFDYRSVFVTVVIENNFEGERDSAQQTLATWTFPRSHFPRGVAIMVLVHVKVQGVKSMIVEQQFEMPFVSSLEVYI